MSRFKLCFPGDNGMIVCQHPNGSWIVFSGTNKGEAVNEKSPEEISSDDDSEFDSNGD